MGVRPMENHKKTRLKIQSGFPAEISGFKNL
jgi:hypothetical protein